MSTTGASGETAACEYLEKHGYIIKHRNVRYRNGELDIVAVKENKLIFVEVKTRTSSVAGMPYEAITAGKLKHLLHAIQLYIHDNNLAHCKAQLDILSIMWDAKTGMSRITHFENIDIPSY